MEEIYVTHETFKELKTKHLPTTVEDIGAIFIDRTGYATYATDAGFKPDIDYRDILVYRDQSKIEATDEYIVKITGPYSGITSETLAKTISRSLKNYSNIEVEVQHSSE